MARFTRLQVYEAMLSTGLVPLFYQADTAVAEKIADAFEAGGARVIEFTNRGEKALKVFAHLNDYLEGKKSKVVLGVGSIVDAPTAALFIANGANFIVSPLFNPEIARLCNRRKIPYLPGTASTTEINTAEETGVEIVKVFPGETVGGPAFIKAVMGPMPWSRIMPTGGVEATQDSVSKWIKAGAACVGMGSNLTKKEWLDHGDWTAMSDTVRNVLQWVQEARSK
jgi:2-dehydro-3-deoxyphosphogluconate aldolase / (4S)-4-hydroxy-2-oxoglutarate aldolase